MKYLHIAPRSMFINNFLKITFKEFDNNGHSFILPKGKWEDENGIEESSNVYFFKRNFDIIKLISLTYKSEKIILHSLFDKKVVIFFFCQPWLLKKCNWIMWGGDLYYYKFRKRTFRTNLYEFMRRFIIKRFGYISFLTQGDYDLAKEWYQTRAKPIRASYTDGSIIEACKKLHYIKAAKDKDQINVIIGNSADQTNKHIQILDLLYKHKDRGIHIFCPLSYGNKIYAKSVAEYGKEKYGEQFHPITEFLDFDEYCALLNNMDIGVFNHDRQQALGNIYTLLYLEKKVYLKDTISTWDHLKSDYGVNVYSINTINNETYDEFISFNKAIGEYNRKRIEPFLSLDYAIKIWRENFDFMKA